MATAALASATLLIFASSSTASPSADDGRLIAVHGQRVFQIEELSLQLDKRALVVSASGFTIT